MFTAVQLIKLLSKPQSQPWSLLPIIVLELLIVRSTPSSAAETGPGLEFRGDSERFVCV